MFLRVLPGADTQSDTHKQFACSVLCAHADSANLRTLLADRIAHHSAFEARYPAARFTTARLRRLRADTCALVCDGRFTMDECVRVLDRELAQYELDAPWVAAQVESSDACFLDAAIKHAGVPTTARRNLRAECVGCRHDVIGVCRDRVKFSGKAYIMVRRECFPFHELVARARYLA